MLLLNFSATPEKETHRTVGEGLFDGKEGAVIILLDTEPFREKVAGLGDSDDRLEQRHRAWKDLFPEDRFELVLLGAS